MQRVLTTKVNVLAFSHYNHDRVLSIEDSGPWVKTETAPVNNIFSVCFVSPHH